jgi:phosphoribosylanthranilate isomerase
MAELAGSNIQTVALFADHPLAEVNTFAESLKVDYVQLHGDETADYAKDVQAEVIKAIAFKPGQTPEDLIEFINNFPADYFVLDRPRQGQGDVVNAEQAAEIIAARPNKIFLAGGLAADNLTEILVQTNPYGIDIAGGVRDAMDRLDITKVNSCLQIIRTLTGDNLGG